MLTATTPIELGPSMIYCVVLAKTGTLELELHATNNDGEDSELEDSDAQIKK